MNIDNKFMVLACAPLAVGCAQPQQDVAQKPNVILILADDIGYGDIAALGNNIIQTPNLDALHAQSSRFTEFHVSPTSSPSRAALMTGRHNDNTGVWHTVNGRSQLLARETTMAQIFQENGYATALFGKWHLGDNYPFRPEDHGFEETLMIQGGGAGQTMDYWDNDYFDDSYNHDGVWKQIDGYCNDVWFSAAKRFAKDNQAKQKPFFCYLATNVAHSPYWVEDSYSAPYKGVENVVHPEFYGMIANLDEHIGELTEYLKSIDLMDNTILIFMTDNGTAQGAKVDGHRLDGYVSKGQNSGMRGIKASMYEGGHRVPMFIHWKDGGISVGQDVGELTAHYDLLPTLIDLCGLEVAPEVAEKLDGQSLKPLIDGDDTNFKGRFMVVDSNRNDKVIKWFRTSAMLRDWRLVCDENMEMELYDLSTDPEQRNNIAAANPEKVAELAALYDQWWDKNSPNFVEEPYFIIGNERHNPTTLYCHDWHTDKTSPWQQAHIRNGYKDNGHWLVEVDEDGTYEFKLRRWPAESGLKIHDKAPVRPAREGTSVTKSVAGKSLPITDAVISVQGVEQTIKVNQGDDYAKFTLELKKGQTQLKTWFKMKGSDDIGAYYVEIEKI
ncbi:MAG: arylsulfatase [Rikenellaceae bacterium]